VIAIDRSRFVGTAMAVGLFFGAALMMGISAMRAEAGGGVRGEIAIREELQLGEVAGRAIVNGKTDELSPWGLRDGARVPSSVLAFMDQHMGPDVMPNTVFEDPAKDSDVLELRRGSLWRSMLPDGTELYVLQVFRVLVVSIPEFWLFVRDPVSDRVSAEPCAIEGRWLHDVQPLHPPRIERVELDGQGHAELVFHGHGHSGTLYNASKDFYIERLEDLSLQPVLIVDPHLYSPLEDDHGDVYRSLRRVAKNHLRMEVYWQNHLLATRTMIGQATLRRSGLGEVFAITDRVVLVPDGDPFLNISDR
jgi:hypothetical protein